jgi:hydroxyacylglutathione hydrolase
MTVKSFIVSPFAENCFVCHDGKEAVLIDPGTATERETDAVLRYIEDNGLEIKHLLLTHAHIDHVFGCAFFADHFGMSWQMHRDDLELLRNAPKQAELFGVSVEPPPVPDTFLREGDTISFGSAGWKVLHCPGHSPGSICFYDEQNGLVISGDALFQGSIGRTDLWQGSLPQLLSSIFEKLMVLPDDTRVYPGHGPATTIGAERQSNPFLTGGEMGW